MTLTLKHVHVLSVGLSFGASAEAQWTDLAIIVMVCQVCFRLEQSTTLTFTLKPVYVLDVSLFFFHGCKLEHAALGFMTSVEFLFVSLDSVLQNNDVVPQSIHPHTLASQVRARMLHLEHRALVASAVETAAHAMAPQGA